MYLKWREKLNENDRNFMDILYLQAIGLILAAVIVCLVMIRDFML